MPNIKVKGQTDQPWERWWTDGRYQAHYLPASQSIKIHDNSGPLVLGIINGMYSWPSNKTVKWLCLHNRPGSVLVEGIFTNLENFLKFTKFHLCELPVCQIRESFTSWKFLFYCIWVSVFCIHVTPLDKINVSTQQNPFHIQWFSSLQLAEFLS